MKKGKKYYIWPTAIAVVYGLFVLYLVGLFAFSRRQHFDLVSKSYYEDELKYQQQIDRMQRVQDEGAQPLVRFGGETRQLVLEFPAPFSGPAVSGRVVLFRPSDAGADLEIPLQLDAAGRQVIDGRKLRKGLWRIKIHWQKDSREYYYEENLVLP